MDVRMLVWPPNGLLQLKEVKFQAEDSTRRLSAGAY